jgi:hypothetical protein
MFLLSIVLLYRLLIENITLLPGERRKIAERLWKSLAPVNSVSKEDEETIALLKKDGKI